MSGIEEKIEADLGVHGEEGAMKMSDVCGVWMKVFGSRCGRNGLRILNFFVMGGS